MNVLFIGCGRTATSIAKKLIKHDKVRKIYLNSRTNESAEDLKRVLTHSSNKEIEVNMDLSKIDIPEYIIITLSTMPDKDWKDYVRVCKTNAENRLHELIYNINPIFMQTKILKKFAKDKKIIVVTNPVDVLTNYLKKEGFEKVYGFGMELDAMRYSKLVFSDPDKKVSCVGIHGEALPVVGWGDKCLYDIAYEKMDKKLLEHVRDYGMPYDFCGERFFEFFDKLIGDQEETVMMSTMLQDYEGVSGVCMSVPVNVRQGEVISYVPLILNKIERNLFHNIRERLESSIKSVEVSLKHVEEMIKDPSYRYSYS